MSTAEKKLLPLIAVTQPVELRRAAVLVLGVVGTKMPQLAQALLTSVFDEDREVRLRSIEAIGKLHVEQALPVLVDRLEQGGEEAEQAAHSIAQLGAKGLRALHSMMPKVAPGLRRYIAAALATAGASGSSASSKSEAIAMLLDSDPGVVEVTVRSISSMIPGLVLGKRLALAQQLMTLPTRQKKPLPEATEWAITRLLAALGDARNNKFFWERIKPEYAPSIRAAALAALGKAAKDASKEQLSQLFACAAEADVRVAAPALLLLQTLPTSAHSAAEWTKILSAPDPAVRQLALEKIGDRIDRELLAALIAQMRHPDRMFRDAVIAKLSQTAIGRKAIGEALLGANSPEEAWILARAQTGFAAEHTPKFRDKLFTLAAQYLNAGDRRADALLFLLRAIDVQDCNELLEARAATYRKKKAYTHALPYLRTLARDPACKLPSRVEMAACEVKVSKHDLTADAWNSDPSLQHFTQLWRQYGQELVERIKAMKWLDAEDMYYLGFHFSEKDGALQTLAKDLLKLAIERSPCSKVAQAAKSKLRREGLD